MRSTIYGHQDAVASRRGPARRPTIDLSTRDLTGASPAASSCRSGTQAAAYRRLYIALLRLDVVSLSVGLRTARKGPKQVPRKSGIDRLSRATARARRTQGALEASWRRDRRRLPLWSSVCSRRDTIQKLRRDRGVGHQRGDEAACQHRPDCHCLGTAAGDGNDFRDAP